MFGSQNRKHGFKKKGPNQPVKHFVALTLLFLCCGYTICAQPRFQNQSTTDLPVIDAHTHTDFSGGPERTSGIAKTEAQYFKEWQEAGVVGAVAHTSPVGANFHELKNGVVCRIVRIPMNISEIDLDAAILA